MPTEPSSSPRSIGAVTLVCLVIASMIGVGVFTSSGFALAALGNPGRVMFAWILCGMWALCGAVGYGVLASRVPLSGGEYLYLSRLAHPSLGFLAGWISLIAGFTAPVAMTAKAAAVYCLSTSHAEQMLAAEFAWLESVTGTRWTVPANPEDFLHNQFAIGLILVATVSYLAHLSLGTTIQNCVVFLKVLLIVVLAVWAFGFTTTDRWQGDVLANRDPNWYPESMSAWLVLLGSMSWITLSYTGFNAAVYVAGQSIAGQRTVPRAMIMATVSVTLIYFVLNVIFVYAPRAEDIAGKKEVAAIASLAVGGEAMELFVRIIIALALISSVFSLMLAGPRVYWQMARDGVMPRLFDSASQVPRLSVLVQSLLSIAMVWLASIHELLSYLGLTLSACGALAVATIWRLQTVYPQVKPIRRWEFALAALYVVGTVIISLAAATQRPKEFVAFVITVVVGFVLYAVWHTMSRSRPTRGSSNNAITH